MKALLVVAPLLTILAAACASTTQASFFNDDPVHGGECGNGNQQCHLCPPKADGTREPCMTESGQFECTYYTHECVAVTPAPFFPFGKKIGDAGRD